MPSAADRARTSALRSQNRAQGKVPGTSQYNQRVAAGGLKYNAPEFYAKAPANTTQAQPAPIEPTLMQAPVMQPVDYTNYEPAPVESAAKQWTLESDPIYQQAIAGGQSAFNVARAQALADMQNRQTEATRSQRDIETSAADSRERLAGNFASRGMAGGAYGALTRAEAEANARQITAQTDIKDQISALNQQYLSKFGTTDSDWTGTLVGQDYRNQAIQQALAALTPKYTAVQ
jgi:hypothetical protein